jgi:glycine/D-amino acid oxidase-like deaminating enzyme
MIKEGLKHAYPVLDQDLNTDVLIIGAGISGALIGHRLVRAGLKVALVDKRHVAHGSTSASTALLQYEIDTPLFRLIKMKGKKAAVRSYQLCVEAIDKIEKFCRKIPRQAEFERRPSLYFASFKKHLPELLQPEFEARKAAGFPVQWLDGAELEAQFGFSAPAAILSEVGAQVNPYLLTHFLLEKITQKGGQVFDQTTVESWSPDKRKVRLRTDRGFTIQAKYVVVASGYESQLYLKKNVTRLHSTYALVSKPIPKESIWHKKALIWETKRPYLYLRTTADHRIILGGRDEAFYSPYKRDKLIGRKQKELEADFKKLFPDIPFHTDFAWAGTFGETEDGLPYIGSYDQPRILYAMGYGGNGITFSTTAADMLKDIILGKKNRDAALFGFDR